MGFCAKHDIQSYAVLHAGKRYAKDAIAETKRVLDLKTLFFYISFFKTTSFRSLHGFHKSDSGKSRYASVFS